MPYHVRLTCPDGTVLQVRRAWQNTVLGIAVNLSALPYLLLLLPGPTPSGRPRSIVPSRSRPCWSGKNSEQRSWRILGRRKGVGVGLRSPTARPSGHTSDQISWPEVPVGDRIVVLAYHCASWLAQARAVTVPPAGSDFAGKRVQWGPRVYELDSELSHTLEKTLMHA